MTLSSVTLTRLRTVFGPVLAAGWVLAGCCGLAGAQTAGISGAPRAGGIWKAVVPPAAMKGEFDNFDPIGIAAGARIKADCSINWVNPDDGALYCFSSGTSLEFFLDDPKGSVERARLRWRELSLTRTTP
jgi:hypothetical protein